jgi:hypothetical protein
MSIVATTDVGGSRGIRAGGVCGPGVHADDTTPAGGMKCHYVSIVAPIGRAISTAPYDHRRLPAHAAPALHPCDPRGVSWPRSTCRARPSGRPPGLSRVPYE